MHIQKADRQLADNFEISHLNKKKVVKKVKSVAKPTVGKSPAVVVDKKTGKLLVKKTGKKKKVRGFKRLGKNLKKGFKKVGGALKKVGQAAALAPLLPLKGVMKKALKKKGVNPPSKLPDLAEAFYNNIVKKSHYDTAYFGRSLERDGYNDDHIVGSIVEGIISFIKTLKKKKEEKKKGLPVQFSPVEKEIIEGSEKVLNKIEEKAERSGINIKATRPQTAEQEEREENEEKETVSGGISLSGMNPMVIVGILIGAYLIFKK